MANKSLKTLKKRYRVTKNNIIKRKKGFGSHLLSKYRNAVRKRKKKTVVESMADSTLRKLVKKLGI